MIKEENDPLAYGDKEIAKRVFGIIRLWKWDCHGCDVTS
jgi:hypothetical protein